LATSRAEPLIPTSRGSLSLAIAGQVLTFRTSEPHSGKNSEHSPAGAGLD
jgi:hypothetical protein